MRGASLVLLASLVVLPTATGRERAEAPNEAGAYRATSLRYRVTGSAPRLNRKLMGPVTEDVSGVPAVPVNSFVWDGDGSNFVEGQLQMIVDPIGEFGVIEASWTDDNGVWTYRQNKLVHPEHWSGMRVGSSYKDAEFLINEGATTNVYLHGDTNAGQPVLPTLFTYLATWGPAEVTRNGEPFENPYGYPGPLWAGHAMVTEGVYHPDGSVRTKLGQQYSPMHKSEGAVEPAGDLEVHLVFHDEKFPVTESIPNLHSFFYHLVFEDVAIEIVQAEAPIPRGRPAGITSGDQPRKESR